MTDNDSPFSLPLIGTIPGTDPNDFEEEDAPDTTMSPEPEPQRIGYVQ